MFFSYQESGVETEKISKFGKHHLMLKFQETFLTSPVKKKKKKGYSVVLGQNII